MDLMNLNNGPRGLKIGWDGNPDHLSSPFSSTKIYLDRNIFKEDTVIFDHQHPLNLVDRGKTFTSLAKDTPS